MDRTLVKKGGRSTDTQRQHQSPAEKEEEKEPDAENAGGICKIGTGVKPKLWNEDASAAAAADDDECKQFYRFIIFTNNVSQLRTLMQKITFPNVNC